MSPAEFIALTYWTWKVRDIIFCFGLCIGLGLYRLSGIGFVSCKTYYSYCPGPGKVRISYLNLSLHVPNGIVPKFQLIDFFRSPSG